eukprot:9504166-Pyramimonas_sp.AAC.1
MMFWMFARVVCCASLVAMGKRGIRDRVREESADQPQSPLPSEPLRRGGVRHRVAGEMLKAGAAPIPLGNGVRKRVVDDQTAESRPDPTPLTDSLRRDWARGKLPANKVLEYGSGAAAQGARGLGRMGNAPDDPKHAHRNLLRAFGWPSGAPEVQWINVAVPGDPPKAHPVVDPRCMFESIAKKGGEGFDKKIRGLPGDANEFWKEMREHVIYASSRTHIDHTHSIPLTIHGDGAATHKTDGLFTISWTSLLSKGSTRATHFIFTVVQKSEMHSGTLEILFADLAERMNQLMRGVRGDGTPLRANGYKGIVVMLRGDWEFFTQALNFPRWDSSPNMCWMCSATNSLDSDLCWTKRGWRRTMKSHESYLESLRESGSPLPALFRITSLRLEGVALDCLHVLDQGIASHIIANALVEVMGLGHWGGNQQLQAQGLEKSIKSWYDNHRTDSRIQGKLTYERLKTSNDWPKLKAK